MAALLVLAMALCGGCAPQERQEMGEPPETAWTPPEPSAAPPGPEEPAVMEFPQPASGVLQCLKSRDGRCLAVYRMDTGACEAVLYDLEDGELLGLQTLPDGQYEAALLPDGTVALLDEKRGQTFWYDGGLTQIQRQEEGWGSQWLLEDTGYLWALDETGLVRRVHLCDGVRQEYQLPEGEEHALVGFGQDRLLIWSAGEEETTAWLDWRTGELLPDRAWDNAALLWQTGNAAVYTGQEELLVRPLGAEAVYRFPGQETSTLRDMTDRQALLASEDGRLEIWDLWSPRRWSRLAPQCVGAALTEESLVYALYTEGATRLYRWDYRQEEPEETGCERLTIRDLEARNRATAAAVGRRTGIQVYYGQSGADFNGGCASGYVGRTEENPVTIYLALEAVNRFTERYPQGMFQEMVTAPVERLELYLSGALSPDGTGSVAAVYGFTAKLDTVRIVVMNLDLLETRSQAYLEQSLAHEFMHVMEDRIEACFREDGIDYLAYWEYFTPGEGAYFYSYFDESGVEVHDPAYTVAGKDLDEGEVWFLDSYSRSYPLEDRGRILEYLYAGEEGAYAQAFHETHIRDKAQYLCAVIRACFPSCAGADRLPWETLVDPVPFSRYQEAVMTFQPLAKG
ncbi:MAG: hypothetical protein BHW33_01915 [Firmicutes bacterium CAG:137_57_8]|nr:MAG: hypothetical protein BHW33_01915 [Firmicutes bacterium CAG:137_57_8]